MHSKGFCTRLLVFVLCAFVYHVACNDSHKECFDVESKSKCYFIPNVSSAVDWDTAWKTCKELNANLPVIMSNEGQKVLEGYLRKHFSDQLVWTAGRYVGSDSEWSWLNGAVDRETEKPPCPDKQNFCVHHTQAVLTKELKYSARYPYNPYAFICEFPGVACKNDSQNSVRWKDGCLSWTNEPQLPLNKARNECRKGEGDLATFSDKGDLERLQRVFSLRKFADIGYWVGLHRKWWIWNTADKPDIKYNLLDEYGELQKDCLFIKQRSSKWSRDKCSERKSFICESEKYITENEHFAGLVAIGIAIAVLAVSVAVVISLIFIRKRCCVVGTEVTKSDSVTSSQKVEYQDNTYATIDADFENLNFEHGSNPATLCKNVETCAKPLTAYSEPADCDTSEHNRSTAVYSEPYGTLTPVLKNLTDSSSDIYQEVNEPGQQKQSDELASPPIKIGLKGDVYTVPISDN